MKVPRRLRRGTVEYPMRFTLALILLAFTGCTDLEDTACFDADEAPEKSDVHYNEAITITHNRNPQTQEEAQESMRGYLRDHLAGSSDKVMCLLDEGDSHCEEGKLRNGTRYFNCLFSHPLLDDQIPEGSRSEVFFTGR